MSTPRRHSRRARAAAGTPHERRPAHRPVRQDPAARGRPRAAEECRRAIAPFAELERAPEHIHTYRLTPLGLWNARAAGHDAEQVSTSCCATAGTPSRTRCWSTSPRRWPATAGCGSRSTRARPGAGQHRPAGARGGAARQEGRRDARRADRRRHRGRAPVRARQPQAGAAQARLAGRGLRRLRRRRGAPDRARPRRLGRCATYQREAADVVLARRLRRRRAAVRRRQDPRRRGRDGARPGDHADPGHQHRGRPAVEGRAASSARR